jgi:hypothetical protein
VGVRGIESREEKGVKREGLAAKEHKEHARKVFYKLAD